PQRINGIEVAEQQNGLDVFASGKIDLHAVGKVVGAVHARASAERLETRRQQRSHAVGSQLVVAGRFDRDEFANRLDQRFPTRFEIAQAFAPRWIGVALAVSLRTFYFV